MSSSILHLAEGPIRSSAPLRSLPRTARSLLSLQAGSLFPGDSQELGPWEEQGAWSPLNLDYQKETWEEDAGGRTAAALQSSQVSGRRVTPSLLPKSCKLSASAWSEAAL